MTSSVTAIAPIIDRPETSSTSEPVRNVWMFSMSEVCRATSRPDVDRSWYAMPSRCTWSKRRRRSATMRRCASVPVIRVPQKSRTPMSSVRSRNRASGTTSARVFPATAPGMPWSIACAMSAGPAAFAIPKATMTAMTTTYPVRSGRTRSSSSLRARAAMSGGSSSGSCGLRGSRASVAPLMPSPP